MLYGVGSRLDSRPELLFLLRDVDAKELIGEGIAFPEAALRAGIERARCIGCRHGVHYGAPTRAARRVGRYVCSRLAPPSPAAAS